MLHWWYGTQKVSFVYLKCHRETYISVYQMMKNAFIYDAKLFYLCTSFMQEVLVNF